MDLRRARVAAVVTLLSAGAGAVAGLTVALVFDALTHGLTKATVGGALYGFGAITGAVLGLLLGPLASFGLLRRVPLGRLFGWTSVGAVVGGLAGLGITVLFPRQIDSFGVIFGGGILGFGIAALMLRRRFRNASSAPFDFAE